MDPMYHDGKRIYETIITLDEKSRKIKKVQCSFRSLLARKNFQCDMNKEGLPCQHAACAYLNNVDGYAEMIKKQREEEQKNKESTQSLLPPSMSHMFLYLF